MCSATVQAELCGDPGGQVGTFVSPEPLATMNWELLMTRAQWPGAAMQLTQLESVAQLGISHGASFPEQSSYHPRGHSDEGGWMVK